MLTALAIRNVVLIEALDLPFHAGLCVLTGETGRASRSCWICLDSFWAIGPMPDWSVPVPIRRA
jgi:hypothetical protein